MTSRIAAPSAEARRQPVRVLLVGLGLAVVPLDTAVNIGFPEITRSFGLPIAMIQWVVICYMLTHAALMLAFGRAGDIWGHGRVFRAGLAWSIAAFLLCAMAPSYGWLLFFRTLQGIGAGLVVSCAPALVTSLYPEDRRGHALGIFTMIFALASAMGPLLGGALVQRWGWPAVFWFRAPLAFSSLVLLRGLPAARSSASERLDIAGAVLLAFSLSALLLAVNALPRWREQGYLAVPLFAAAVGGFAAFIRCEARAAQPIVRLALFRLPGFALVNLASVLIYLTSFSVLLFVPYYLGRFAVLPLPIAGAVLASGFIGMAAASPVAGRMLAAPASSRTGAPLALLLGTAMVATGLFLIGSWRPETTAATMVAALLLQGCGLGVFQVAYMEVVMSTLPPSRRGVAGSLSMLTRTVGVVTGATALTLVFNAVESAGLARQQPVSAAFLDAFATTFRLAGAASVPAALAALSVLRRPR